MPIAAPITTTNYYVSLECGECPPPRSLTFQLQNHIPQVRALDLRDARFEHFILVRHLRVQPVALPRARPTRPTRPLPRTRLGDGRHDEAVQKIILVSFRVDFFNFGFLRRSPVHAELRIEGLLLVESRIHHVVDTVDGQTRLGDVGGHNALS